MRNISILNEDYVLYEKCVSKIENDHKKIRSTYKEMISESVDKFISACPEDVDAAILNFIHEGKIEYLLNFDAEEVFNEACRRLRKKDRASLKETVEFVDDINAIFGKENNDDAHKRIIDVFSEKDTDIPETNNGIYDVILGYDGRVAAMKKCAEAKEIIKDDMCNVKAILGNPDADSAQYLKESLYRLAIAEELRNFLSDEEHLLDEETMDIEEKTKAHEKLDNEEKKIDDEYDRRDNNPRADNSDLHAESERIADERKRINDSELPVDKKGQVVMFNNMAEKDSKKK